MPPECVMSRAVTFKTDVYAFGIILLGTIIGGMCKGDQPRGPASALFRFQNLSSNFIMQKEDSPSHQNVGTYMEY
jgi:serine/threonine protein kinase